MVRTSLLLLFSLIFYFSFFQCQLSPEVTKTEVLVIGGSTGGTAAGIEAARSGANTLLIEPTTWLGGMLTAAGVSAIDGNHHMPAGIWGEFRRAIRAHYGGADKVATGWISHTLFEPKVGATVFAEMAEREANLDVWYQTNWAAIEKIDAGWRVEVLQQGQPVTIEANIVIDATELGDVAAAVGADYWVGMDARQTTGEAMAPEEANDIIQDLTFTAILQDYGPDADRTIPQPADYDPTPFLCACQRLCENPDEKPHPCETMLSYARLPNDKYLINWPLHGNDFYANAIDSNPEERAQLYAQAKQRTLQFVYFIQHELGYKNLGIAEEEFPTEDDLPLIPYHREGRRIKGLVQLTVDHILEPYNQPDPLYRTGIAVGDYPIDHHHAERADAPDIDFPPVPSFNVPLGSLIPAGVDDLLIAEKPISVTNIVNGSTRLQPVVLQLGQAAGLLAALAVQENKSPTDISVRAVQTALLARKGYLLPYYDVSPEHPHFVSIQKVGATGILRGTGEPYKWANRTWFYPDTTLQYTELVTGLQSYEPTFSTTDPPDDTTVTIAQFMQLLHDFAQTIGYPKAAPAELDQLNQAIGRDWEKEFGLVDYRPDRPITKAEAAVLLDELLQVFSRKAVDMSGNYEN